MIELSLPGGRSAEVGSVGPEDGEPVLYFHSPSTSGEELGAAASAATQLRLRILTVRRPSLQCDEPDRFVATVAEDAASVAELLALRRPVVMGWSGGAPYALAMSARPGFEAASVVLVSPLPGPLTGPDAVPDQSARLREVANTTSNSSWASGPSTLRDYQAVAAPWPFDASSITRPVTIWAPVEDQIVPLHLAGHLARSLPSCEIVEVPGAHDWLIENWETVLKRIRDGTVLADWEVG